MGNLQVAAGLVIEHQEVAENVGAEQLQGHLGIFLGVFQIFQQAASGANGQGQVVAADAFQRSQPEGLQQALAGFGVGKGALRSQGVAKLAGQAVRQLVGGFTGTQHGAEVGSIGREQRLGGLEPHQFLPDLLQVAVLGREELSGGHIGVGQSPVLPRNHHCSQEVIAAGAEHPFFKDGTGGDDASDFALDESLGLGGVFNLIADGDRVPFFHQLNAVAIEGMVGNPRHWHPPDHFPALFAGQHQLQLAGNSNTVFKKGFEKVAHAI